MQTKFKLFEDEREEQYKYLSNPLNGKSKEQAAKILRKMVGDSLEGFFRDESWIPINTTLKLFTESGIDWDTYENSRYTNFPYRGEGLPRKEWFLVFRFTNNNGKPAEMYGKITAASADENFDRYDVTFTVN